LGAIFEDFSVDLTAENLQFQPGWNMRAHNHQSLKSHLFSNKGNKICFEVTISVCSSEYLFKEIELATG